MKKPTASSIQKKAAAKAGLLGVDREKSTARTEAPAAKGKCGRLALERALRKTRYSYSHPTVLEEAWLWDGVYREERGGTA